MSQLPIYKLDESQPPASCPPSGNRGLWFTRFFNGYDGSWQVEETARRSWLGDLEGDCGESETIERAAKRQIELTQALGGVSRGLKTDWNFVTGLGLPHPVENGFTWHPTLGTPYLCGAAVKGLLRAWYETEMEIEDHERQALCNRLFGTHEQAGALIFFDALPTARPMVGKDVMTPHMGKWYEKGGQISNSQEDVRNTYPADWHSPIPVEFLVVQNAKFVFSISPRRPADAADAADAMGALEQALEELGAGAKTAVGYGSFSLDKGIVRLEDEIKAKRLEREKAKAFAEMEPFDREIAQLVDEAQGKAEVPLIKGLEAGKWQGEDAVRVARKAKELMQEGKRWRLESAKKNPSKDHHYQRTQTVLGFLGDG